MPLTVFDIKGVPGSRRERIEAAVIAGGRHVRGPHEAWIAADPFKGGFRVLITGAHGFERTVMFALDDDPAIIAERVRDTLRSRASAPSAPGALSDIIASYLSNHDAERDSGTWR